MAACSLVPARGEAGEIGALASSGEASQPELAALVGESTHLDVEVGDR